MAEKKRVLPPGGYIGARPKDPSGLSKDPAQIRRRLRRAVKRAKRLGDDTDLRYDLEQYRQATGFKPVEEWDLEELAHGKPRNSKGGFQGRQPTWITPDVAREAKKRLYEHAFGRLGANVDLAVQTLVNLIKSEETDEKGKKIVDARTKLDAVKFIIEHVIGKPTSTLQVDATDEARTMFAAAIVLDDGKPQGHLVIEGDVVDDDE